ncbi:MAG TPA: TonB-dependent receptor, partial [candidate division Zixibacteria bacterium]|nr:TonB-dependent receptor [candidate division Zixibacteria bacterium]
LFWLSPLQAPAETVKLSGSVYEMGGYPVVGATVALIVDDSALAGVACDTEGRFTLKCNLAELPADLDRVRLEFSAIGFRPIAKPLKKIKRPLDITVTLAPVLVQVQPIISEGVYASHEPTVGDAELKQTALRSPMPTNPLEAVRDATVTRSGSALGSRLRFNGSAPEYTLNGASIGADPAHYGMFAFLPSAALQRLRYSDHATDASAQSPTTVALETDRSFTPRAEGELTLSALEGTSWYRRATSRAFIGGALRKSVIDKLVRRDDANRGRQSIPPTNFQDIAVTGGVKLSPTTDLFIDQYLAQDFLAYNTRNAAHTTAGVETFQHTRQIHTTINLRRLSAGSLWNANFSARAIKSHYRANSTDNNDWTALQLELFEEGWLYSAGLEGVTGGEGLQFTFGAQGQLRDIPTLTLTQRNWNFQPPRATSDNPHYLQAALNQLYGNLSVTDRGAALALYTDLKTSVGGWSVTGGLRAQRFDYLAGAPDLLLRAALERPLGSAANLRLTAGTYAETPLTNILEPYQILIRAHATDLRTVKTRLAKAQLDFPLAGVHWSFAAFGKRISDAPELAPRFESSPAGAALTALTPQSIGRRNFYGASLAFERHKLAPALFGARLNLRASYAYTHSVGHNGNSAVYLSEDAPHRLECEVDVDGGRGWRLSGTLSARTGYRYTPFTPPADPSTAYSAAGYDSWLGAQNHERFPAHVSLNLSLRRTVGSLTAFASLTNALDRGNPMISLSDEFVFDSGALPSAGISYAF